MTKEDVKIDLFLNIKLMRMSKEELNLWFDKYNLILYNGNKLTKGDNDE